MTRRGILALAAMLFVLLREYMPKVHVQISQTADNEPLTQANSWREQYAKEVRLA